MHVVVMGVSATGKTTVAEGLAEELGCEFVEGDSLHPSANIAKMTQGVPLTDEDRWPWLAAIAAWIDARRAAHQPGVVTCSALKRRYREALSDGRPEVRIVLLDGDPDLIGRRITARHGHYMRPEMLASQFNDLERPEPDEQVTTIEVRGTPAEVVEHVIEALGLPAS